MWSSVRHRRLQALSLVALAALLTTSLCLGPLYQRAMEQALAASVVAAASPSQKAVRLSSNDLSTGELVADLPGGLKDYLGRPVSTASVSISVVPPGGQSVATRLYSASEACQRLRVVDGECPSAAGEVMVSSGDVAENGWTVGTRGGRQRAGRPPLRREVRTRGHRDHRRCLHAGRPTTTGSARRSPVVPASRCRTWGSRPTTG